MKLVLLGPPGAGKGTLAAHLKDALGIVHISTGDILREEMDNDTELGRETKQYIENGELVPDDVVTKIIKNKLTSDAEVDKGYLLDGYPRTEAQAEALDDILAQAQKRLDYVIYLESSLPVLTQRLTGRRVCKDCGALYHATNKPPQKEGVCDACGGTLYQRKDDNADTIKTRMDVYLKNVLPIVNYYKKQGILKTINADQDSEKVYGLLTKIFNENGKIN